MGKESMKSTHIPDVRGSTPLPPTSNYKGLQAWLAALCNCAPGRAHSLEGGSPLRTLMTGTVSRTARAVAVRRGLEEAVSKTPARGTRSAYEAINSGRGGNKIQSPIVIRRAWEYMRRVYGVKVGAQYPGRSAHVP